MDTFAEEREELDREQWDLATQDNEKEDDE